jgi:mannosyltransferase OCH1-like enzyme
MRRASTRLGIIILAASLISLGLISHLFFRERIRDIIDKLPVSEIYQVEHYDFIPSDFEKFCFSNQNESKPPIPNIVHYIIGLADPELSYAAYLSIESTIQSIDPRILKIHHTSNLNQSNEYIQSLLQHPQVVMVHHDPEEYAGRVLSNHYAHLADILRLEVLLKDGGIYLDSDVFALQSF